MQRFRTILLQAIERTFTLLRVPVMFVSYWLAKAAIYELKGVETNRIVGSDAHLCHVLRSFDAESLVDLKLHRQTMGVPPETSLNVESVLMHPSGN